jgi:nucleotide-binding universal stress UspA family protein
VSVLVDPRHADPDTMAGTEGELAAAGIPHTVEHRSGRDPVEELVDMAGRDGVELVVIGMRRRSPVGKLSVGSAAQRILLDVSCPVLPVEVAG